MLWGEEQIFIDLVGFCLCVITEKNLSLITSKQMGGTLSVTEI